LKYKYEKGKATVKVEVVGVNHPCGSLVGTENIVSFISNYKITLENSQQL